MLYILHQIYGASSSRPYSGLWKLLHKDLGSDCYCLHCLVGNKSLHKYDL